MNKRESKKKYVSSKWIKTLALIKNTDLITYIPETRKVNFESLDEMLNKHHVVYVKPSRGSLGKGVMRIKKTNENEEEIYEWQQDLEVKQYSSYNALYNDLNHQIQKTKRLHIVQKGIDMVKYKDRSADIRVMVQQNTNSEWEVTGIIARLSHPKKVVTNISSGGIICNIETLINHLCPDDHNLIEKLKWIGLETAKQMNKTYPNMKESGLDIALDQNLHPWILEVNTKPSVIPFTRLEDKRIIDKIVRYGKAYGRHYYLKPKFDIKGNRIIKPKKRSRKGGKGITNILENTHPEKRQKAAKPFPRKYTRYRKRFPLKR
ncbi:YheC/YheD family protein [Chengkuizengella marina]|uniref:YheC/YheD family protein n=1 Tax=Chengkuizengella marina TaxID=2507566 RepID=A0A6N9Q251_9BACL|nr:YheC/YheD family protein [Chengkuizengella marina]NBI27988.1 YheC/YheD family protein [Chengkuizengella marina]